uniref:Protein quiver n=1 Tax=Ascaris lumbricoides TaxID=6252 RepID=A0A0M3IVJ0_ASCLU
LHKQHEFILGAALRCVQCGQGNLQDAEADCEKQIVVECNRRGTRLAKEEQYFCFTRQILIGPGRNAVEKMCVTQTALIQEYGSDVVLDGCTSTNTDRVRFCPITSCFVCNENNLNSAELDCSKPVALDCDQQFKDGSGSLCLTRRTQLAPGSNTFPNNTVIPPFSSTSA